MPTVTVPGDDITTSQVADALRDGLGPRYTVLPGTGISWNPVDRLRPEHADAIVVGLGSARLLRAQVKITHSGRQTVLHLTSGGISPLIRLTNRLWITEKARRVLRAAPDLRRGE
jgi:hypothetical protein